MVMFPSSIAADAIRPDPKLGLPDWAEKYRRLTSKETAVPGPWRNSVVPYMRQVMECLSASSPVNRVILMKGAQIGATEVGNNWIGYVIHHAPGPMMVVQPTTLLLKRFSKHRLDSLLESNPAISERVGSARPRSTGDTLDMKEFKGGVLVLASGNSAIQLASMPVRYLFYDEADHEEEDVTEEGDSLDIAEERTTTYRGRRKIYVPSTPRRPKGLSRIESEFLNGDRRRYFVPCPHCGGWQVMDWSPEYSAFGTDDADIPHGHVAYPDGQPEEACYICGLCGVAWTEAERAQAVRAGEFRATRPFRGTASFHAPSLISLFTTIPELAEEFERRKKHPDRLKTFVNLKLALTFEQAGQQADPVGLRSRRETYPATPLPEGVCLLTAAADVQDDRIEVEVVGWGVGEENWGIELVRLYGDPKTPELWRELDAVLVRQYQHPWGELLRPQAACIDSGGHHTGTVYQFCAARWGRRVWAIKGRAGEGKPIIETPSTQKPFIWVGVDPAKTRLYQRLGIKDRGPGYQHFPDRYPDDYFDQLTAEKRITVIADGRPKLKWVLKDEHQSNEALDLRVYNIAALAGLNVDLSVVAEQLRVRAEEREKAKATKPAEPQPPTPVNPRRPRGGGGWATRF